MSTAPDLPDKSWAKKNIRHMAADELRDAIRALDGYTDPAHAAMRRAYERQLAWRLVAPTRPR